MVGTSFAALRDRPFDWDAIRRTQGEPFDPIPNTFGSLREASAEVSSVFTGSMVISAL